MDIVILGIQGSGKGTQGRKLSKEFGFFIFEMGAVFRELLKTDSPLAEHLKGIINKGNLVDDENVMKVFYDAIEKIKEKNNGALPEKMIFDGIPRRLGQKKEFDLWMEKQGRDFVVLNILISEEEALNRLVRRKVCASCGKSFMPDYDKEFCDECGGKIVIREDESADAIRARIKDFKEYTEPVLREYEKEGKLININGKQAPDDVYKEIKEKLSDYLNN